MMQKDNNETLVLSSRQSSLLVAALLFFLFFTFLCGYFLGTKHATEEFIAQINQETFADQVLASVHSFSKKEVGDIENSITKVDVENEEVAIEAHCAEHEVLEPNDSTQEIDSYYAAELIGFGTQKAAQLFIDRVAESSGITLELRTRSTVNRRGKTATWYQVVTPRYAQKHELELAICTITKTEKLHDINIVSC